jgi:hypothetical protein
VQTCMKLVAKVLPSWKQVSRTACTYMSKLQVWLVGNVGGITSFARCGLFHKGLDNGSMPA